VPKNILQWGGTGPLWCIARSAKPQVKDLAVARQRARRVKLPSRPQSVVDEHCLGIADEDLPGLAAAQDPRAWWCWLECFDFAQHDKRDGDREVDTLELGAGVWAATWLRFGWALLGWEGRRRSVPFASRRGGRTNRSIPTQDLGRDGTYGFAPELQRDGGSPVSFAVVCRRPSPKGLGRIDSWILPG
jgi:hypothetical protein